MTTICADAGFLIGVYDERDERHEEAVDDFVRLFGSGVNRLLIPWPILYETVSTRMARNVKGLALMERDWKRLQMLSQIELIPDDSFREGVLDECFEELRKPYQHYRSLSAADRVVRRMLSDVIFVFRASLPTTQRISPTFAASLDAKCILEAMQVGLWQFQLNRAFSPSPQQQISRDKNEEQHRNNPVRSEECGIEF